ncbi:hypothetical protein [Phytohabitans aurantiacus]|uniref:Secreted protein n=1 Tax=Phytohabitans aurantiacus TaxID=3016789 RepID=A0ABQ5RAD1_9ACTN|nr:hypothetical protein [Phytohabitans aurantiacus]GLI03355.1 hypothetical protein Pa4123_86330 [Phytohabitans aurantiacus]
MRVRRTVATVTTALLAGSMQIAGPAQAAPDSKQKAWNPKLVSTESLYDGSAVRLRYTDGSTVFTIIAAPGDEVTFIGSQAPTIMADGRRSYDRAVSIQERSTSSKSSATAAAAYAAAGRSPYTDALAAGMSPTQARQYAPPQGAAALDTPPISSTRCLYSETSEPDSDFEWSGCRIAYYSQIDETNNWRYSPYSVTAHGWGTGALGGGKELQKGSFQHSYTLASSLGPFEIIEASPSANATGSSPCGNFTVGLAYYVELSYNVPLCSDGWNVTWNQTLYKVEWYGASAGGESDSRSAAGAHTLKTHISAEFMKTFTLSWTYACFLC